MLRAPGATSRRVAVSRNAKDRTQQEVVYDMFWNVHIFGFHLLPHWKIKFFGVDLNKLKKNLVQEGVSVPK